MKNVLLIAFACKPNEGSESGVGWNFVKLISQIENIKVHVLVWAGENQQQILSENNELNNVEFIFYDLPNYLAKFQNKQTHNGQKFMEIYYMLWQLGAYKMIIKKFGRDYFDIVHHITFVSATLPSIFVLLKAKFIWGPLSSNDVLPKCLQPKNKIINKTMVKDFLKKIVRRISYLYRLDKEKAEIILINTPDISNVVRPNNSSKIQVMSSIGIEGNFIEAEIWKNKINTINEEINVFSIGKFIDIKNFDLTIEAFAYFCEKNSHAKLYLVGDGPNRKKLEDLVLKYKIENRVVFLGWKTREEVLNLLKYKSHILLYPTAEKAGITILEALSLANPVVGLDYGGPGQFVNEESGVLVPLKERNEMIKGLSCALESVVENYDVFCENTCNAVLPYIWETRLLELKLIYNNITN